jgi:hypothetical protein
MSGPPRVVDAEFEEVKGTKPAAAPPKVVTITPRVVPKAEHESVTVPGHWILIQAENLDQALHRVGKPRGTPTRHAHDPVTDSLIFAVWNGDGPPDRSPAFPWERTSPRGGRPR